MIHTNRVVTVGENESIIDRPIVLYRGDREVEIEFELVGNEFMFSKEGNVIKTTNASHGQLVLNTPSGENMFSELAECHDGKVAFIVTKEMIDEFIEIGFYSFQIRLYDSAEQKSRVTLPPILNGFDIRNPIAAEDETNVVDYGIVDYARIFKDQSNEELPTFTWDGVYNKTEWVHHDVITENKLNKIEDALYSINANVKETDVFMFNTLDQVKKDADAYVKEHIAEVEQDVEDFERNINTGVETFKVDIASDITEIKNDVDDINNIAQGIDSRLKSIVAIMPDPSDMYTNTENLQQILDLAKNGTCNLTVFFKEGLYELQTCVIYDNTTLKLTNKTTLRNKSAKVYVDKNGDSHDLRVLFTNAKPFDIEDATITGYNGRSNITIEGGIINPQCAFVFCHGKNINIRGVTFMTADGDHYIQIGACKNVNIENCSFLGMLDPGSSRNYVEYIQIDWMTEAALPYWLEGDAIYDGTVNDGFNVVGCDFDIDETYNYLGTAIGSHSSDGDNRNKNITIRDCVIKNYSYASASIHYMENVLFENNKTSTTGTAANGVRIYNSNNVSVSHNRIDAAYRGIFATNNSNTNINNNNIKASNGECAVLVGECNNTLFANNAVYDSTLSNYIVLVRNCDGFTGIHNTEYNTTSSNAFYRVYVRDGGVNERIAISNTVSSKPEVSLSSANSLMTNTREVIWSGTLTDGSITLEEDLSKFKNLKIMVSCYGSSIYNLDFVDDAWLFKTLNMADTLDGSDLGVSLVEFKITKSGNTLTMTKANGLSIKNGTHAIIENLNCSIRQITGERIHF